MEQIKMHKIMKLINKWNIKFNKIKYQFKIYKIMYYIKHY